MKKRLPTDHIITIINQKGGVGKTSSCTLMATLLGLAGYQCLVIDNDSQANTTATLLPDIASVTKSIVDIFRMNTPTAEEVAACIYHTPYQGVDLIPSRPEHQRTDDYLYSLLGRKAIHKLLKRAIKQVEEHYDYILIDTHPDLGGSVQNALCCSDYVLIPVKPDGYSYQGVTPIINQVLDIASDEDLNPELQLLGVFLTCAEPRNAAYRKFYSYYQNTFGDDFIPVSVRLDRSVSAVCNFLIPLPYLLGSSDYQAGGSWKAIYDYIELMKYTEITGDEDYIVLRTTFEILERNLAVHIPSGAYDNPYIAHITPISGLSDACAPYENHPFMTYSAMLDILNQQQELCNCIQRCLLTVGDTTRNIRYCSEDSALSEKYSFVRIAALKPAQEV